MATSMELSELLTLMQYEVQKSYDFSENLSKLGADSNASVLQLSFESIEIDLPVSFGLSESVFNRSDNATKYLPRHAKLFRVPFSPEKLSLSNKGTVPRGKIVGKSISVELLGHHGALDEKLIPEKIARVKLKLRPVIK